MPPPVSIERWESEPYRNDDRCEPFANRKDRTKDHIPPETIFGVADRKCPLILSAHESCNQGESQLDEVVGNLLGLLRGELPPERSKKFGVAVAKTSSGAMLTGVHGVDLRAAMGRWLQGFHAALYGKWLPYDTGNALHPPLPEAHSKNGQTVIDEIQAQQYEFVKVIKRNRLAGCLDRIESYNGKCVYECVWDQMDNGTTACF